MIPLALAAVRLLSFVRFRDTRKRGVETSLCSTLVGFTAGWHARMSSRLAGKGACALSCASVSNIRLRPSPRLDIGGRQMRKAIVLAALAAAVASPPVTASPPMTQAHPLHRALVVPPPSFLRLCVASGVIPMMFRLNRLVDLLKEIGRTVMWQPTGTGWIMRERWHDDLDQHNHEVSFLLTALRGAVTGAYCPQNSAEVSIQRVIVDGAEMTGMSQSRAIDSQAQPVYGKDIPPPDYPPVPRNRLGGFATGPGMGPVMAPSEMGAP